MIKNNIRNYIFTAISERKKEKGKKNRYITIKLQFWEEMESGKINL